MSIDRMSTAEEIKERTANQENSNKKSPEKILAIEASGQVAGVAIISEGKLLGEYSINHKKTHSETLLPMIDAVLKMTETTLPEVTAIAVSKGPGSFTGLRIGSATAKGLALAADKPIIAVPTVDALAYNMWGSDRLIVPLMDARRRQVYTGYYHFAGGKLVVEEATMLCLIEDVVKKVNELGRPVAFLGDGADNFHDFLVENCSVSVEFAPAMKKEQSAASVACLGAEMYAKGQTETATEHKPDYLRPSQAERELGDKAKDFTI